MKKVMVWFMGTFLVLMTMLCLCVPKQDISESERRKLNQFPEFNFKTVTSGKFMSEFEEYAADQFPFRELWRTLKARISFDVLKQSDNNELYIEEGHVAKIEYPLHENSISRAITIFQRIQKEQLADKNCKVYYTLVPDKNYFFGEEHLQMDYKKLVSMMNDSLEDMTYIDIMNLLSGDDYYKTDAHWKQENLTEVAKVLGEKMGVDVATEYDKVKIETPFYGVYYGQIALSLEPDELHYLTNETLEHCEVYDYQNQKKTSIYDREKVDGEDLYEMFLSGSISLLEIKNPDADTDKELVLFRDSFGSSIAPLLVEGYQKITLVDIRYLPSSQIGKWVDFENADVLFLYSTSVLNHSETLK